MNTIIATIFSSLYQQIVLIASCLFILQLPLEKWRNRRTLITFFLSWIPIFLIQNFNNNWLCYKTADKERAFAVTLPHPFFCCLESFPSHCISSPDAGIFTPFCQYVSAILLCFFSICRFYLCAIFFGIHNSSSVLPGFPLELPLSVLFSNIWSSGTCLFAGFLKAYAEFPSLSVILSFFFSPCWLFCAA